MTQTYYCHFPMIIHKKAHCCNSILALISKGEVGLQDKAHCLGIEVGLLKSKAQTTIKEDENKI